MEKKANKQATKIDYRQELDMQIEEKSRLRSQNQLEISSKSVLRNLKTFKQNASESRIPSKYEQVQFTIGGIASEDDRK